MDNQLNKIIFIVGNSRSGTTMLGRILNKNIKVHTMQEIHFFEKMFNINDVQDEISQKKAIHILNELIAIQIQGFYKQKNIIQYKDISEEILNQISKNIKITPLVVYYNFLIFWTKKNKKLIPCEQTPKNLYYSNEIVDFFPNAIIINLVRDPRSILLSQKNKWKRKFLGEPQMPFYESFRAWALYHPITISRLWTSALSFGEKIGDKNLTVKFEDLISNPSDLVQKISAFCKIDYSDEMLMVPQVGSSINHDEPKNLGINKKKLETWKNKNISKTELFLLQKMVGNKMIEYGYKIDKIKPNYLVLIYLFASFPFKIALALILNIGRMKNIIEILKRRISK